MYIAYSAIRHTHTPINQASLTTGIEDNLPESLSRYNGYQAACQKLSHEIAAIQKYIPGWMPTLR